MWLVNMGAHCTHDEDPIGITHGILYMDAVDILHYGGRGVVDISTLVIHAKSYVYKNKLYFHW